MVEFSLSKDKNGSDANVDHYKINVRDLFVPTQVRVVWLVFLKMLCNSIIYFQIFTQEMLIRK